MALSNELWNAPPSGSNFYEHQIANSVRIPAPSSTAANNGRLTQTFGTVDSNVHFTVNFWIKRGQLTGLNPVASARVLNLFTPRNGTSGSVLHEFIFCASGSYGVGDAFAITNTNTGAYVLSTHNEFRDTTAWYNIHVQADLDNSTNSEKLKIFINGTEASYNVDNRANFTALAGFTAGAWTIGDYYNYGYPAQASLASWCYIDGTTLGVDSFAEDKNGVWVPKDLSGLTFGSAGHLLMFQDSSALGDDTSGNGNDWTAVNIATHDQMLDSPTFGSSNGGNFATYLGKIIRASGYGFSMAEGNLKHISTSGNNDHNMFSNMAVSSGKWYAEFLIQNDGDEEYVGIASSENVSFDNSGPFTNSGGPGGMSYLSTGNKQQNGSDTSTNYATFTTGDIISVAMDVTDTKVYFAKNGTWQQSGDPANATNPAFTNFVNAGSVTSKYQTWHFGTCIGNNGTIIANFGQEGSFAGEKTAQGNADSNGYGNFFYAPPSGFLAMCSGNLPIAEGVDPAEDVNPNTLFQALAYTGNANNSRAITTNFDPDIMWFKRTDGSKAWNSYSKIQGIGSTSNYLDFSRTDELEPVTNASTKGLLATASTSMTVGALDYINGDGLAYISYLFNAGGSAATNNDGNLESTIYANAAAGISHGSYTGTAATKTVGHGLGVIPDFIIVKRAAGAAAWAVYYGDNTDALAMNTDGATADANFWADTTPSSSVFTVGNNSTTGAAALYVFWAFANTAGFVKAGFYSGTGRVDGGYCHVGFKPSFIMVKNLASGTDWIIFDDKRDPDNGADNVLYTNSAAGEVDGSTFDIDILANGWKVRTTNAELNADTADMMYLAIGSMSSKYATAR